MTANTDFDLKGFLIKLSVRTGKDYTEEQLDLASDFTKSTICFADPGSGKTDTATVGLVTAELFHGVPADKIVAMSFTRLATVELKNRHENLCKKLGIKSRVTFRTLDSMCREIIKDNYEKLGMENLRTGEAQSVESLAEYLLDISRERGIPLNPYKVRSVVNAIRSLNSALIFDQRHVESKLAFKKTGMKFDDFTALRKCVYEYNKIMEVIPVGDISLYALEILTRYPEVSQHWKDKNKFMLVDEFQDMSLLKLRLISLFTENLVVIGDMKQQIYGFNGASTEIIEHYRNFFPDHKEVKLTQSFRCDNTIADYATGLILPNKIGGEDFKGKDKNGFVKIHPKNEYDIDLLCQNIQERYVANNRVFEEEYMFLFRNNHSAIPISEKLFQHKIPFIVNKYIPAHQIPVIKDLSSLAELARNPHIPNNVEILNKILPEFGKYDTAMDNPIYKIMRKHGLDYFAIAYNYDDGYKGELLHSALIRARELYNKGALTKDIFNALWPAYDELYLKRVGMYLEQEPGYYIHLVSPLTATKTLQQFFTDEMRKVEWINTWTERNEGIRCYTFHASKGTEADIVHIMDADEGLIPNTKKLEETINADSALDAARELRNERSLVYVAATRAKKELHIHFNTELASLFTTVNKYSGLDNVYENYREEFNDVQEFQRFFQ